jgi:transposase-like protein
MGAAFQQRRGGNNPREAAGVEMKKASRQRRIVTPAQRGQIVQRVLVDGWTSKQAARAARLDERLVAAWVAAYRRDGMASLHRDSGDTSVLALRLWRPLGKFWRGLAEALLGTARPAPKAALSPLHLPQDDRRHGV